MKVKLRTHALLFYLYAMSWLIVPGNLYRQQFETDCGCRAGRREPRQIHTRNGKIIAGHITRDGQFPWQASLELLHPSLGFLGHWCGAVLIHQYWILSAAHCVHNDLFNLPIPPLWTVVLGEHDRTVESGHEQRIPVEKIVLHRRYENFRHDLVLMKLSKPANLTRTSNVRRICLPFVFKKHIEQTMNTNTKQQTEAEAVANSATNESMDVLEADLASVPDKLDNFLSDVQSRRRYRNMTAPSMRELMSTKLINHWKLTQVQKQRSLKTIDNRRRNDKLMRIQAADTDQYQEHDLVELNRKQHMYDPLELAFIECVATGWGKSSISGDLSNQLLKTTVPLHKNDRCIDAYGSFVNIHAGHLCAGKLNGKGGTCVGDSGGPLQCRLTKNGPWILAGVTSFGSGCAIEGFPDVYTRTSYYMQWIEDTIAND